ncbi:transient receptor potential cation channel protein painless [Hylaeus anthracinus]|uniref:transient receptor potential cation channel protein painless n=1 Tax=Hylaeus anthracinus TaxID=313031 RepID=UPI0023B963A5|nr:transient receptor potential cation channel protein painless [Hylaeus anthracinus]
MDFDSLEMRLLDESTPAPMRSQNIYRDLLNCLKSNNFETFKKRFENSLKDKSSSIDVNYVHQDSFEGTFLDIACKNGLSTFVEFLIKNGAQVNRINTVHKRGPIHFAVENGHAKVLEALLQNPKTDRNLQVDQQTALHMAVKNNDEKCAKLLLENLASPNIPNMKGLTAIHMAANNDQKKMVKLILEVSKYIVNLDKYRDYTNQTARDILRKKYSDIDLPLPSYFGKTNIHDLKYSLNNNDEAIFLSGLEILENDNIENDNMKELIEMAVNQNLQEAVSALLKRVKEGNVNCDLKNAALLAIRKGSSDLLDHILNASCGVDMNELLLNACLELGIPGKGDSKDMSNQLKCVKLILKNNVDVKYTDGKGNTPLHYAARADCREAVTLLLEKGSYIGYPNNFGVAPIADISASTLSRFLDDCIQTKKDESQKYMIEFDYKFLNPYNSENDTRLKREMDVFQFIADNSSLKHLLNHPLLSSFLYLKWYSIRHVFWVNIGFYVLVYFLLNAYIYIAMGQATKTSQYEESVKILRITTFVAMNCLAFKEILQLILAPCHYVTSFPNWMKMVLVFLYYAIILGAGVEVAAVTILLSAWQIVLLIGQHPLMSTGIEMFKTVFLKFMRFLLIYAFLILAFAFAFYMLFKNSDNDKFPDLGQSLFKTIIMFTGEFNANEIPFVTYPILSHIVFILFVFLIAIVLLNLLNGLAVNDTADILNKAELIGLISRIKLLVYIEKLAVQAPFIQDEHCLFGNKSHCCWTCLSPTCLIKRLFLFPNLLKNDSLSVPFDEDKVSPTVNMDRHIIKQTKQILSQRSQESDNEKIINEMRKIKDRLSSIEYNLNYLK